MKMRWFAGVLGIMLTAVTMGAAEAQPQQWSSPRTMCEYIPTPENPAARPVRPPHPAAKNEGTARAAIQTNHGNVVVELDRANAPCAVHNLVHLARKDFYDDSRCWRLTNSARLGVLQCGDIYSVEKGGPGYRFADEVTGAETYPRGTVAMGNQGPDTNGSQFFIVHSHANIKPGYTVLGRVVEGMDVLDEIVAGGIIPGEGGDQDGEPALPVEIENIKIRR
ncbi:peptidylprolyl isomerase [Saccharopolyspora shandongensis]|uniref:peptidylprolyl isomerase n=1 Tax=Saccharopolyspora shandongensis TaxID=418495 RepID=UPI003443C52A